MEDHRQIGEHIVDHLTGREGAEVTDPVLVEWLSASESNKKDFERYKHVWNESATYLSADHFDENRAWDRIDSIHKKKGISRRRLINLCYVASGIAASLLLLVTLSFMGIFGNQPDTLVSMAADYGSRSEIVLPDGSKVKLNAGSNITYTYNPKEKIREVCFQGEGYFDVSKSKTPFVVKMANGLRVKVWGTSFNLQAYSDDPQVQASLVEGCIELNHGNKKLVMKAGDMAVFDRQTTEIKPVSGVLSHSYSWLDGKLYMNQMSLSSVCKFLERRYDVTVSLDRDLGESIHYDGVIKEEAVTDILDVLSRLSNISYNVKGNNISITSK